MVGENEARNAEGEIIEERFTKENRTRKCEELMRPEVRELFNLPLHKKIRKTQEIIRDTIERYPNSGLGFSGGTDSLVLLHVALPIIPKDYPIIFVNTFHQFPETYKYIDRIIKSYGLTNYIEVTAEENKLEAMRERFGWKTPEFTEVCCGYHKIAPLKKAIEDLKLSAFVAGIRGVEHEERAKESVISPRDTHFRVHPLLFWTQDDVLNYVKEFDLETNPLYKEGYTSLGCIHCTEKNPDPNAHERAGRGIVRETIMERLRELGYT
jgi:phosphoadenosine phosphosulfate reductase